MRPQEPMKVPSVELHISRVGDDYLFLVNDPSYHTSLLRDKLSIPHTARNIVLRKLQALLSDVGSARSRGPEGLHLEEIDFNQNTVDLGTSIFKYLLPLTVRKRLEDTSSKTILLTTDDTEIPWELLYDGRDFLCLKCNVGRKVQTKMPFRETQRSAQEKLRALFIADPAGDLPDAEKEATSIIQTIADKQLIDFDYLKQEEATVGNILEKLEICSYDILHYAGHAEFNSKYPEESSLVLHDERITAGYIFQVVTNPPTLVFMNACSSARTSGLEYLEAEGKLSGMATAFLSSGVDAYIGTLWPVHDEVASKLSSIFYERILRGESIGSALTNAKNDVFKKYSKHTNTWAAFVMYGEPTSVLAPYKEGRPIQEITKVKHGEITYEPKEPFRREIRFHSQVGEVFNNIGRAFKQAKGTLGGQINLEVEARGIPEVAERRKRLLREEVRIADFTVDIYGEKRCAAEFLKHLAQIHIFWYRGYDWVSDPVEHFIKECKKHEPSDWWKLDGYIDRIDDITKTGDGWIL